MSIETRKDAGITYYRCDGCRAEGQTNIPDGVVPDSWGTGRLRIDLSMAEEVEFQLCFCPDCAPGIVTQYCPQVRGWPNKQEVVADGV